MMTDLERLAPQDVCYLITKGRVTVRPHKVEIWFALNWHTLYILIARSLEYVYNEANLNDIYASLAKGFEGIYEWKRLSCAGME